MRAYVIVTAVIFGMLTVLHLWRVAAESAALAHQPEYMVITALSALLCAWGVWVLVRRPRTQGTPPA
jgi:EamA domain-containing membrane protein RarD